MTIRSRLRARAALLVLSTCAALPTLAADAVTDAMQEAYGPYRVALFKTNSNSQTEAQQAMTQAQQSWGKLAAQFGAKPPAPYDRDGAFGTSLAEVSRVYTKATEQVAANQLTAAHETLEAARDIMAQMRHRNQVIVYSDHMNAYHSEMEHVLIDGAKTLAQPNGMQQLTAQAGVLTYLSKKLSSEAPASYTGNAEFTGLVQAVDRSVADLQAALFAQNAVAVKEAMGKIKGPYSKLFLKFG
ncbi:MAG: hypothetical protein Q7T10_03735 [Rhodoferax sp.]|uniref:hypothetical protein n=1 Tax=Rhodoferax sp. TaxID=50421 RepID=UPI00271BC54E|nr:hypothetical protein [Rhodoferax sp.]MDO8447899.1 hypothetical protein [Rhodoferax sp.]